VADLAKLVVRLEAESSKLTNELERANRKLSSFEKSTNKAFASMKASVIGLASALGADLFKSAIKSSLEFGDTIAKTADKVGLATDSFQAYSFAAERSGISTSQFNSNMTAFVKRVGEARAGVGPLTSFLKRYDQTLLENIKNSQDQEEALKLIADAIYNASTETDKAAIANAAFSRSGIGMVNALDNGTKGLVGFKNAAIDSNAIIEEGLLRTAERMNDRWDTLTNTISVKFKRAILEAASLIEAVFYDSKDQRILKDQIDDAQRSVDFLTIKLRRLKKEGAPADVITRNADQLDKLNQYLKDLKGEISGVSLPDKIVLPEVVVTGNNLDNGSTENIDTTQDDAHVQELDNYKQFLSDRTEALN